MAARKAAGTMRQSERFDSLAAMQADARRRAEALDIEDATLAEWYALQLAAATAHRDALAGAHEANLDLATRQTWPRDDARWEKLWLVDARLRYAAYTVELLERRKHILVCPTHGVRGVDAEAADWRALADRGLLTGEGALSWYRYCERCSLPGIEQDAAALARNWRLGETTPATGQGEMPQKNEQRRAS